MTEVEIPLPEDADAGALPDLVEAAAGALGLTAAMRGSLRSYPGSLHWHFRRPHGPGTLEVTLWPAKRRLWLHVQAGRCAAWTDAGLPALRDALMAALRHAPLSHA